MNPKPHSNLPDRLTDERTILVVVDIQEKFRDKIHGIDQVVSGTTRLVEFCQELGIPVIVTEHYPRGLGETLAPVRDVCVPFEPIEKINFSCAGSPDFNRSLDQAGRDQVILCGIESHVCIYQTAADLLRSGKQVIAASDAISSCSAANRQLGLDAMAALGVQILGAQMVMFEVLRVAGTARFKKVAPLLKE
jgi:nicotinamidase-related amidase